jgi:hypothetical protein
LFNSIELAGLSQWKGQKFIISDGYKPDAPPLWQVFQTSSNALPLGSAKTFLMLLRKGLELDPFLSHLTYLQDDIILAKNSLEYISQIAVPGNLSLISWFNTDWYKPDFVPPSILGCRSTNFFIRSQMITMTRPCIEAMLYCPAVTNWNRIDSCDAMPAWALGDILYADHYPSLIQHTEGFNSACNLTLQQHKITSQCKHVGARLSPSFVGEDFDALSLFG